MLGENGGGGSAWEGSRNDREDGEGGGGWPRWETRSSSLGMMVGVPVCVWCGPVCVV